MDILTKVLKFVFITLIIGIATRVVMAITGIDKKIDGKYPKWDAYRKKEKEVVEKTRGFVERVSLRALNHMEQLKEEEVDKAMEERLKEETEVLKNEGGEQSAKNQQSNT